MRSGQTIPYVLPSVTYSAGTRSNTPLRDLPKMYLGRICHVSKFLLGVALTPTYTTAPTVIGNNNLFSAVDFWDGSMYRFQGGLNHIRAKERIQAGGLRIADADADTASGTARYFRRVIHAGPPQFEGAPSDFVIPCGMLSNGELRFTHGALTDVSADTTAITATVRVVAFLALLDEVRIPPAYTFGNQTLNQKDVQIAGRALYESVAMLNSASFDAIGAGDFGSFRLDFGQGDVVPSVDAEDLTASYNDDFARGAFGVRGEPEGASDDNEKIVSATSVSAAPADLQPVVWAGPDSRISKLMLAESSARLSWNGSQASGVVLYGRILPQPASVVGANLAKALGALQLVPKRNPDVKTLSKKSYNGPLGEFMPWVAKVK